MDSSCLEAWDNDGCKTPERESVGWNNPTYDENHGRGSSENRRGRPKAASLTNLMLAGAKSQSAIKCSYCARVFPREKSLQAHQRIHTGERPYACNYPGCSRAFTQSGQLKTHQRLHTGEKPFVCSHQGCGNRFTHANRHCVNHPEAMLTRSDSSVLRPVFLNPIHSTEVDEWLEKYKSEKKNQEINKKCKNQENEEVENNNVTTLRKVKQSKTKDAQLKRFKSNDSSTEDSNISTLQDSEGKLSDCHKIVIKNDKVYEQKKIELPKKRWLREACQDQSLQDLNQSRPTVLILAGKENDSKLNSPPCSSADESKYSSYWDYEQAMLINHEDSCGSTVKQLQSDGIPCDNFESRANEPEQPSFFLDAPSSTSSREERQSYEFFEGTTQRLPLVKRLLSDIDRCNVNDHTSTDKPQFVPNLLQGESLSERNDFYEFTVETTTQEITYVNTKTFLINDTNDRKNITLPDLSPPTVKPLVDSGFLDYPVDVQSGVQFTEQQPIDMDSDSNCNDLINFFPETPVIENSPVNNDDGIYNSPKMNLSSNTTPTPSKWNDILPLSCSTPIQKLSSAYKKRIHGRFMNSCSLDESICTNNPHPCLSKVMIDDQIDNSNVIVIPPGPISSLQPPNCNIPETNEEILAYPLPPICHDTKPLNLSNCNEYLEL